MLNVAIFFQEMPQRAVRLRCFKKKYQNLRYSLEDFQKMSSLIILHSDVLWQHALAMQGHNLNYFK